VPRFEKDRLTDPLLEVFKEIAVMGIKYRYIPATR
jgi:hypothetical protein